MNYNVTVMTRSTTHAYWEWPCQRNTDVFQEYKCPTFKGEDSDEGKVVDYADGEQEKTSWSRWTSTSDERQSAAATIHKLQALLRDLPVSEKLRTLGLPEVEVSIMSFQQT